jgi:predicted RNase H-like nuclease (RuvC/YqgF family)
MDQKNSKIFDKKIMQAVSAFCSANNIEDIDDFIYRCFKQGFDINKYGFIGKTLNDDEKHLIKEVIVEKRLEIPVEVIKEVEKIIEVPVEVIKEIVVEKEIIKEVPVEKIVEKEIVKEIPIEKVVIKEIIKEVPVEKVVTKIEYISDKSGEDELVVKINSLEEKIFNLNQELEKEKQIFSTKTEEMENNFHYDISKKDDELDELRRILDDNTKEEQIKNLDNEVNILKNDLSKKDKELDELRRNLDVKLDDNKVKMLQQTIQNLNSEIRELKKKNEELEKKLLDTPKQLGNIPAKFHGSSNLNNDLYK